MDQRTLNEYYLANYPDSSQFCQFRNDIKDPGLTNFLSNMSMMNMRIGHRYQISLPNGKLVAGICDKIDQESVILRTMIKSWVFLRDDLKNSKIEEIRV